MTTSTKLPLTVDAKGRKSFPLLTIRPIDRRKSWRYSLRYYWRPGRRGDVTSCSVAYALPYKSGPYTVMQGPLGSYSHQEGSGNEYAIDWAMPVGTTVCAARSGTVVGIRQDSDIGGPNPRYKVCGNYVIVGHDDGTFAEYCHLKKDGVLVKLGQSVEVGEPLAVSGNTGYSSGPHLHFVVFCTIDGETRRTIPVKFLTRSGTVVDLNRGDSY